MNPKLRNANCNACPYKNFKALPSKLIDSEILVVQDEPDSANLVEGKLTLELPELGATKFALTTAIGCKSDGNSANLEQAIACCAPRLKTVIEYQKPTRIITLGKDATRATMSVLGILPSTDKIAELRGKEFQGEANLFNPEPPKVFPVYSPGYLYHNPHVRDTYNLDLQVAAGLTARPDILSNKPQEVIYKMDEISHLSSALGNEGDYLAFDIETTYLEHFDQEDKPAAKILCVAFASRIHIGILVWDTPTERQILELNSIFKKFFTCAHNSKFDMVHLQMHGIDATCDFDTILAHHLLEEKQKHDLKTLAANYFNFPDYADEIKPYLSKVKELVNYNNIPKPLLYKYAALDVWATVHLCELFKKQLTAQGLNDIMAFVMQENDVITQMQKNGIQVDAAYLDNVNSYLERAANKVKAELLVLAENPEFNPGSPTQVAALLYDKFKLPLPTGYAYKGKPRSTDTGALEQLSHPVVDLLKEFRTIEKLSTSYAQTIFDRLAVDGRVFCDYYINGTVTGRLSVREPALQTIPRGKDKQDYGKLIKAAFTARDGHMLVMLDYSQAELRVAAALAQDEFLLSVYNTDRDLHSEVATRIWGADYTKAQRSIAKIVNFGWLYGANGSVIAAQAKIPVDYANDIVADYEKLLNGVKVWRDEQFEFVKKYGYIATPKGRRQRFGTIDKSNWRQVWKSAANTPIQGGASELTIESLIRLHKANLSKYLVLTVHDSILLEVPFDAAQEVGEYAQQIMQDVGSDNFPLVKWKADLEIDNRWTQIPASYLL